MTLERLSLSVAGFLRRDPQVAAAYLFGSAARGLRAAKDVDVALLLEPRAARRAHEAVFAAQAGLEDILGRPVDVVVLNDADPFLRFQVYAKGRVLFERRPREAHAFLTRSVYEYWDMLPLIAASQARAFRRLGVPHGRRS